MLKEHAVYKIRRVAVDPNSLVHRGAGALSWIVANLAPCRTCQLEDPGWSGFV